MFSLYDQPVAFIALPSAAVLVLVIDSVGVE